MIFPANYLPANYQPIGWSFQGLGVGVAMDFLVVNGTVVVLVEQPTLTRRPVERHGSRQRGVGGQLGARWWGSRKMQVDLTTAPMTDAQVAVLKAAAPPTHMVVVNGGAIGGFGIIANVQVTSERYVQDGLGHQRQLALTIEEV